MMVKKKKKQTRYQSSTEKKTLEPNLLSILHSKSANGKDMSSKPAQGVSSSQSRVVRCPKCHKFLQEPVDVTIYKCSGCNSILQAKHWELGKSDNSIHQEDLFSSSQNRRSLTPVRSIYRKYSSRTSPSVETAYNKRHETSYIPREWIRRRADEFSVTSDFASSRSCSSVVKLSITKKEDTSLLDLLKFVDPASDTHLSSSDKVSGDRTDEDKGIKERDTRRSMSSELYELKLETFQPSLNHKLREQQQQPTPRIHLKQSAEGGSKTPVRSSYRKYNSRGSPLYETGYRRHEETSYISREWMSMTSASPSPSSYGYTSPFHGSQVSGREGWFHEFSSSAAASPIRFQGDTSDQKCYHWSSQQSQMHDDSQLSITKKEETSPLDIHQEDSASDSHQSSSDKGSGDRVCINTDVVKWETFEDKGVKENIRSISSKFIDLTFQPQWNHKLRAQTSLGSGDRGLNKKEHVCETNVMSENNTRGTQDQFDLGEVKWEDILGELPLEKSRYTSRDSICDSSSKFYDLKLETFQPSLNHKEDTNSFLLSETSREGETGEERSVFQKESYYEGLERRWAADTVEDRVGLNLEEYETNYENYRNPFEWSLEGAAPTFDMPVYEPEEEAQVRSIFSSIDFFNDHESSKEKAVAHEEEPWLVDENKIQEPKVGVVVENGYESTTFGLTESTTPMFCLHEPELGALLEPYNAEADGSSKLRAVFHQEEESQVMMSDSRTEMIPVKLEDIFEWTSQRAPTFRLYDEPELGALVEPEEDAYGRSESSSKDHVIPKEREMDHGEVDEPWLVDVMAAEDGPSLNLEKSENEKMLLEQTVEPREDIFRLSIDDTVEQEWVKFDSETFKQGDTEENTLASGSMLSPEVESEAGEKLLRDILEHLQKENDEKSRLTSEVVGLRHALYQTQTQTSPILTPIGSPHHILMRSRTASPMRSHIVSPLRSPTNTSGSLSDVLFLAKKT